MLSSPKLRGKPSDLTINIRITMSITTVREEEKRHITTYFVIHVVIGPELNYPNAEKVVLT